MAKANETKRGEAAVAKTVMRDEGGLPYAVEFAFSNGEKFTAHLAHLDVAIYAEAAAHGIAQKIGDATAISRNPDTGASATVADKYAAAKAVYDRITGEQPTWNAIREGGGNEGGLLLRALVEYYAGKRTADEVKVWLDARTDAEKTALRKNEKVAAIILRMQTAKADPSIDSNELLDSMGDE
jgi:hypothetical protein